MFQMIPTVLLVLRLFPSRGQFRLRLLLQVAVRREL